MNVVVAPEIVVGSDVLEIMTIAMYAEPLVIYRELVQNSADAIERAISADMLAPGEGTVDIRFDRAARTVTVIDNGYGLPCDDFMSQMLAFGASAKRTDLFRGFRGIGRLAGLGYCRKLIFRSRSKGDTQVSQAVWDGLKIREAIQSREVVSLEQLAKNAVEVSRQQGTDEPEHFFEARLEGIRRLPDDRLFDAPRVASYLAEIAPVRFSPVFSFGEYIRNELLRRSSLLEIGVRVGDRDIFKPYEDAVEVRKGRLSKIVDVEFVEVPSADNQLAAFGWLAHTEYLGALRPNAAGRGLRVRSGNLQVGDGEILSAAFPEERFNGWAIGEFHIFDRRLRPNARRDAFEPSVAVDDLFNQLAPHGIAIAKRCRFESRKRRVARQLDEIDGRLDKLEEQLRSVNSPLADAIRTFFSVRLETELASLSRFCAFSDDPSNQEQVERTKRRALRILKPRQKQSARLSQRALGQMDVLAWLYEAGHNNMVGEIAASIGRR